MDSDRHPAPRIRWQPWLLMLALWLLLVAITVGALWQLRLDAITRQTRELGLLSQALTDELRRGLRGAEEGLNALRVELRERGLPQSAPQAMHMLHTRADLMPLVRTLWLVDHKGRVIAASDSTRGPELQNFSPALEPLALDAISLSRPFADTNGDETLVAMAMPFQNAPGIPGGWVLASLHSDTLLGAFRAAQPADDARMAVYRVDGVRLAGANMPAPIFDEATVAQRLADSPELEQRRLSDGSVNLVGLRPVARYELKVLVARKLQSVLKPWRAAADLAGVGLLLLLAVMASSVHFVLRANRRNNLAQGALQAQMSRASKLEALGTLAGGVAHDFNNVLAGIVGFGEMAQDAAPKGSAQSRHLDKVLQAAMRGKALVERILSFSRGGAQASTVFELEPVVEEVLTLLSASLGPNLVIERELAAPGARLKGDPTQAFEAVMNLGSNAVQAMPNGGVLRLKIVRVKVTTPRVLSHSSLQPGDYLALSVADQGGGITPAVMERLFEPFFTTRSAPSGTGLGLAVVHGVVSEFGGAIDVQSQPGWGARFTLYLPECMEPLDAMDTLQRAALVGAGQALLVVDDEPGLVALAEEMLRGLGYAPTGFTDSALALAALREQPQRFAAVITDELMPGLTGTQLIDALQGFAPHIPVLLVSGWGGALLAQRASAAGARRVLTKPLRRAELARALAELLA